MKFLTLFLLIFLMAFGAAQPAKAQFSDAYDFMQAVEKNDIAEARNRILGGINVNSRRDGMPAFMIALSKRYYDMARLLLESGAYVNFPQIPNQDTALMMVSTTGDEEGFKLLMEFNPDVNAANKSGQTALMKAVQSRKTSLVKMLIEAGADIYQTDYVGRDALQYAREARARGIVKLLEDARAE